MSEVAEILIEARETAQTIPGQGDLVRLIEAVLLYTGIELAKLDNVDERTS